MSYSANAAGGSARIFKRWREDDEDFSKDWDEAIEEGTDYIEDTATTRALTKSDALMAMILKARRPDKYDRGGKLELSGGINVEGSRAKLLNRIARIQAAGAVASSSGKEEPQALGDQSSEMPALPPPEKDNVEAHTDSARPVRGSKRRAANTGSRREKAS